MISMTARSDWHGCRRSARESTHDRARLELLRIAGVLGDVRAELDVRAITKAVVEAFDEHDVPDDARRAVLTALRSGGR